MEDRDIDKSLSSVSIELNYIRNDIAVESTSDTDIENLDNWRQ